MEQIQVAALTSIPTSWMDEIHEAMRDYSNPQRLTITLFFLSDLGPKGASLSTIESELKKIFPASIRHNLLPDQYEDFAAAAIRGRLNAETNAMKSGKLSSFSRLWANPERGHWKNTNFGNQYAINLLGRVGFEISVSNQLLKSELVKLPKATQKIVEDESDEIAVTPIENIVKRKRSESSQCLETIVKDLSLADLDLLVDFARLLELRSH